MVIETFVMLTKMALEIQPPFTSGFVHSWSCSVERRGGGFLFKILTLALLFSQSSTLCILQNLSKEFLSKCIFMSVSG